MIKAQLLNVKSEGFVMDFVVEGDKKSIHVLDTVFSAFASSFPFSKLVVDMYIIA